MLDVTYLPPDGPNISATKCGCILVFMVADFLNLYAGGRQTETLLSVMAVSQKRVDITRS